MLQTFDRLANIDDWWPVIATALACLFLGLTVVSILQLRMRRQTRVINAALNNMAQGLVMFDGDRRVVTFNQRYVEIYRLTPDAIRVGCSLHDLLRVRADAGTSP